MDELTAIGRAKRLVEHIKTAPVDVAALAEAHGMEIKERDLDEAEAGNTVCKGGKTYIVVNKNDDPYRRRFTVLHEMGHHILDLPSNHSAMIQSSDLERFPGRPVEERLCDVFAAECLVPRHLIAPIAASSSFSVEVLHELSEKFQASRPCIASSFVRASRDLVAYVYSEDGRIHNVICSAALRDQRIFIQGGALPSTSAAALALAKNSTLETADLDASDWSSSDAADNFGCYEEAFHMPKWGQTLSLLTFEAVGSLPSSNTRWSEEDELLPELTGQLPWPKK